MRTLYLDMDGVVADFDEYAARTLGIPPSGGIYPPETWHKLSANQRIYRDLKPTPYAAELVEFCRSWTQAKQWDLFFLTAVPKNNDVKWAFYDKVLWGQIHFPDIPVMFGPYSKNKYIHCRGNDILVDDRLSNIKEWSAAGGVGIHHVGDPVATINQIKEL